MTELDQKQLGKMLSAKTVTVALASRLADANGREIAKHYGVGSSAIAAIHRRLTQPPDSLDIVESLAATLRKKKNRQ